MVYMVYILNMSNIFNKSLYLSQSLFYGNEFTDRLIPRCQVCQQLVQFQLMGKIIGLAPQSGRVIVGTARFFFAGCLHLLWLRVTKSSGEGLNYGLGSI